MDGRPRINAISGSPIAASAGIVAVLLRRIANSWHHIGVFHRDVDAGRLSVLHLAEHYEMRNDELDEGWRVWIDPALPRYRANQVALLCRQVATLNGMFVPYGFSLPKKCFNARTGKWLLNQPGEGLTCATLVMAVFETAGLPLLEVESWQHRDDDKNWQEDRIEKISKLGADPRHIAGLKSRTGSYRFRPVEVAAGTALFPPPARFEAATELGATIEAMMVPKEE